MKKLIFSLLILASVSVKAQNSYTFSGENWAWLVGKNLNAINTDSASAKEFRNIRDQIRTANPATWVTNVTVTNIPDWVGMAFYRTVKTANAGEVASRYAAITSQIEGKASLATAIAVFNLKLTGTDASDYERVRAVGKYILMDQ
jgi:hypothetical protein